MSLDKDPFRVRTAQLEAKSQPRGLMVDSHLIVGASVDEATLGVLTHYVDLDHSEYWSHARSIGGALRGREGHDVGQVLLAQDTADFHRRYSRWRVFEHWKGGRYTVCDATVCDMTLDVLISYVSLELGYFWTRTVANWQANVVDDDGEQVPRFKLVPVLPSRPALQVPR